MTPGEDERLDRERAGEGARTFEVDLRAVRVEEFGAFCSDRREAEEGEGEEKEDSGKQAEDDHVGRSGAERSGAERKVCAQFCYNARIRVDMIWHGSVVLMWCHSSEYPQTRSS